MAKKTTKATEVAEKTEDKKALWIRVPNKNLTEPFDKEVEPGKVKSLRGVRLNLGKNGETKWGTIYTTAKKILPYSFKGKENPNVSEFSIEPDVEYSISFRQPTGNTIEKDGKEINEYEVIKEKMTGKEIFDLHVANTKEYYAEKKAAKQAVKEAAEKETGKSTKSSKAKKDKER